MSLIPVSDPPGAGTTTVPPDQEATPAPAATKGTLGLRAPMRLNPAVRDALEAIVRTLNPGPGPAECCTVAEGLFVPLDRFEQRGVPPAVALRALAEVGLLVASSGNPAGPPTRNRDFGGVRTVGLVVDPRSIDGVDLRGFLLPQAGGE